MKKRMYCILSILYFQMASSQKIDDDKTIAKMNLAIKDFFIDKGEIGSEDKLGIGAYEITDETDLGDKEVGIYLIRTVYRTDGTDYLFLKNGENFEFLDFNDLKKVLDKSIKLLKDNTDEELSVYISKLMESYKGNHLCKIKNSRKMTFKKGTEK